jgi:enoyl-CoA hydratase/carnithine racemase
MTTETIIDTGTNELLCVIRDRVAVITLNRPEVRNALSDNLTPALRTMIRTCGENSEVGALLITGAGAAFCAGGDVKGMGARRDPKKLAMSFDEKVADLQERQRLLTGALVSVRKPTIAARAPRSELDSPSRWPATSGSPRNPRSCPPAICASG